MHNPPLYVDDKVKSNILLIKYIYRACSTTVEHGIRIAKMGVQFPPGPQLVNHKNHA